MTIPRDQRPVAAARRGSGRRGFRALAVTAVLASLGLGAYAGRHQLAQMVRKEPKADKVPVITVAEKPPPAAASVLTATGKIVSDHTVNVSTKVSGQITALFFEQGDHVEAGQVLAHIEDVIYRARRDEAAARLTKSQANLEFQKVNFKRVKSLHEDASAPPIELADAKRLLDEARAQVAADRAALDFAQKALDDTVVTAPIAGVVLTRNVEVGDFVAAEGGIGANANARFATIADMSKLRVEVDVSELDIARLSESMPCRVTPDAYKDRRYPGHIMWIDPGANYSKATVQVKVRIENPDEFLRVEGSAQVDFLSESPENAEGSRSGIWIPNAACARAAGSNATVMVVHDDGFRPTEVTLGATRGDYVQVVDGLTAGQKIAAAASPEGE